MLPWMEHCFRFDAVAAVLESPHPSGLSLLLFYVRSCARNASLDSHHPPACLSLDMLSSLSTCAHAVSSVLPRTHPPFQYLDMKRTCSFSVQTHRALPLFPATSSRFCLRYLFRCPPYFLVLNAVSAWWQSWSPSSRGLLVPSSIISFTLKAHNLWSIKSINWTRHQPTRKREKFDASVCK